jgi:hypothetical protein
MVWSKQELQALRKNKLPRFALSLEFSTISTVTVGYTDTDHFAAGLSPGAKRLLVRYGQWGRDTQLFAFRHCPSRRQGGTWTLKLWLL